MKKIIYAAFAAGAVALLAACSTNSTAGLSVSAPPPTTFTPAAAASPGAAAGTVLLTRHGKGGALISYTIGGDGDYTVYWTFAGNTDTTGSGIEFSIDENNINTSSFDDGTLPGPQMADSGSGSDDIASDTGTHQLSVAAPPGCTWTITLKADQ